MIKNTISYHVEMPNVADMENFITNCDFKARKPGDAELQTVGFSAHPVTGQYVADFQDGYCITVVTWKKNIKASMIKPLLVERINALGYTPKKDEKSAIKDDIITELLAKIPAEPKTILAYYHLPTKKLIVDTSNQKDADLVTSLLRKTIGSLKATTLYVDQSVGLTAKLADHLYTINDGQFTSKLRLGNTLTLKGHEGDSVTYKNRLLTEDGTSVEIVDMIRDEKMNVKEVELICDDVTFKLTDGFKLKSINYGDMDTDTEYWQDDAWLCVTTVSKILTHLVSEFTVVKE